MKCLFSYNKTDQRPFMSTFNYFAETNAWENSQIRNITIGTYYFVNYLYILLTPKQQKALIEMIFCARESRSPLLITLRATGHSLWCRRQREFQQFDIICVGGVMP